MNAFHNIIKHAASVEAEKLANQFMLDCVTEDYTESGMPIDKFTVEKGMANRSELPGLEAPLGLYTIKANVDEKTFSNKVNRRLHCVLQLMMHNEELTYPVNVANARHCVRFVNDPVVIRAEITIPVNQMYVVHMDNFLLHVESEVADPDAGLPRM